MFSVNVTLSLYVVSRWQVYFLDGLVPSSEDYEGLG